MMKRIEVVMMAAIVFSCVGCASITNRGGHNNKPVTYPGVRAANEFIGKARGEKSEFGSLMRFQSAFFILDWPFSFVVDTLCLPFDLARVAGYREGDHNHSVEPTPSR
jgi:uncharacterized protein YceK